jgi:hypothetical protein
MFWKNRRNEEKISELESTIQRLDEQLDTKIKRITELENTVDYWKNEFTGEASKLQNSVKDLEASVDYWKNKKADESLEKSLKKWMDEYYKLFDLHDKEQKIRREEWREIEEEKKKLQSEWEELVSESGMSPIFVLRKDPAEQLLRIIEEKSKRVDYFFYKEHIYNRFKRESHDWHDDFLGDFEEHFTREEDFQNDFQGSLRKIGVGYEISITPQEYFCEDLKNCDVKSLPRSEFCRLCFKPILNKCSLQLRFDKDTNTWNILPRNGSYNQGSEYDLIKFIEETLLGEKEKKPSQHRQ